MNGKVLRVATVQSHIAQFHKPLMKLLKENGWKIHVAARNKLAEKNGLELEYPDKVFDIPFQRSPFDKRNINAYIQLREVLKEEHYDVIHCNTPVGGMLARLAGNKYRKNGTQIFYTAHGFHFYQGAPLRNWVMYYPLEKIMSNYTDKLITITEEDYRLAEKKFHCPVYHIHGVGANSQKYHPVSTDEKEQIKKELGIKGHIIINVGELLPNKNQKTAIRAMKEVIKRYPDAYLLIAGNGKEVYRFGIYEDTPVKDTTGAGDAFGSGFLASIASGKSFRSSLIFASANSTSVVTKLGANRGILSGNEDLHLMPIQKL